MKYTENYILWHLRCVNRHVNTCAHFFQVNEELGSIFPLFKEFSSSGNALERVLALEIELAEALRSKKKPSMHFQRYINQYNHAQQFDIYSSFLSLKALLDAEVSMFLRLFEVELF